MQGQQMGSGMLVTGALFLLVVTLLPGVIGALTGVNVFFDPYNYNEAIEPNDQGVTCVESTGDYDPDDKQQRKECSAVATVGMQQANQIFGFFNGAWIALIVVGAIVIVAGFIVYRFG